MPVLPLEREALQTAQGRGVRVMIADSGVDATHPALRGATIRSWEIRKTGTAFRIVEGPHHDIYGHGTAVTSIVHEMAPAAAIDSVRILGEDHRGSSRCAFAAIEWAIEQGVDVINCSFGSPAREFLAGYKALVDRAFCRNVLIVAASNNVDFRTREYPAHFPTVFSTTFGDFADPWHLVRLAGELVEFRARGENVRVAWLGGRHTVDTGSSFAAPHVTGIVARIRELRPGWNACEVMSALYSLAVERPAETPPLGSATSV